MKLIPNSRIDDNNLKFQPFIIGQDMMFIHDMLVACPFATVVTTDFDIYCYRYRVNSTTHNMMSKHVEQVCDCFISEVEILRPYQKTGNFHKQFYNACIQYANCKLVTRILSSSLQYKVIVRLCRRAMATGFFQKEDLVLPGHRLCYFLVRHPLLMKLASYPKRYIYDRFLRKYIIKEN